MPATHCIHKKSIAMHHLLLLKAAGGRLCYHTTGAAETSMKVPADPSMKLLALGYAQEAALISCLAPHGCLLRMAKMANQGIIQSISQACC
jgi:hypothetical protein